MGHNCPAGAMPINGMVQQYFNNLSCYSMLTNKCSKCSSANYALDVAHNTGHTQTNICQIFSLLQLYIGICSRRNLQALSFWHMLGSIQAAAGKKCTPQFLRKISITHKIHSQLRVVGLFFQNKMLPWPYTTSNLCCWPWAQSWTDPFCPNDDH